MVAAVKSLEQADHDRGIALSGRAEAEEVIAMIREHNASNNYDEWIRRALAQ